MNHSNNSSALLLAGTTGFLGGESCRQLSEKAYPRQESDSIQTVDNEGTINLIDAVIGANIRQFVYVSQGKRE